ncbi:D-alanyl-D-alanine carboxypeptidase/D-alanyl-D-alanine-endopeptidase [Sulfurihydrogenibium sp.]|uniref:D-alanyl-D-alanine carboxypeptidase/D-alanyl-D-alanine endopeptidase n=1 Tax=Sulfurihydrogenibium sp. TaxID=2053621 RepID=UPI00261DA282|nr:D-alanyl-D-alanine carboxypeptidase/D-alanyl-D-alanine-endopeptidase [Sulfurihydrogenibium sp.]
MKLRLIFLFVLSVFFVSLANSDKRDIKEIVQEILKDKDVRAGIYVESLTEKKRLLIINSQEPFIPASNQKILTTATALINLTPDYRFKTQILTDGYIRNGVVYGNLYLKGGADPSLTDEDIERIVKNLKEMGIKKVEGSVVGDNSFFSEEGIGHGWPEKDLNYCFTAPFSGLSLNENCLRIKVVSSKNKVFVELYPDNSYYQVVNDLKVSKKLIGHKITVEGRKIYITGSIKPNSAFEISVPVESPSLFTTSVFYKKLVQSGISIDEGYHLGNTPSNSNVLFIHYSHPLKELIKKANKDSDNFYAEQIFRTLGKEILGKGNTESSSLVVLKTLRNIGVNTENIRIYDGSGLSKFNLITPESLVKILSYMYNTPYFFDFYQSLAVAGTDGTLKHRFRDIKGKIYAKTGYIKGVKNLSGYVISDNSEVYVFSILVNDLKSTEIANLLQEKICSILVGKESQL